ncbi:NAD-dependent epimerase/dehydratase family protein [Georgenia satyanarayanai]|uniref:SDR family oxidoreductase n=1 Tax=Georgenia satyanarayanai TaxID=860221 RepID=UPI00203C92A6|nr:NAD-dependent epimerase/dehydratase family protein [Georgenia satyanarayanai]MCM3659395.1 NAD-dependent epimerase/dehydratase family protein [Georgenia satyanarayanai]
MKIAVAGGTGVVGRHVVEAVSAAGHEPVVVARSRGVDLTSGAGLDDVLDGVGAVVDVSNVTTLSRRSAERFFVRASGNLLAAGRRAGVQHHVLLSIVGVDRCPLGYYRAKLRQEEEVLSGPLPATVLRATQFHEFVDQTLSRVPGPVAVVPRMRMQPVAASEVAAHLVEVAAGEPQRRAADLAGPEVHEIVDLARQVTAARGLRRRVLPVRMPGGAGRAMTDGSLLPTDDGPRGRVTFQEWLDGNLR